LFIANFEKISHVYSRLITVLSFLVDLRYTIDFIVVNLSRIVTNFKESTLQLLGSEVIEYLKVIKAVRVAGLELSSVAYSLCWDYFAEA